jgi:RNA polymerase sigma factor (sigma-70 family)
MKERDELFRSLYQKYYRRMVKYFRIVFRTSDEDAEDLAHDAFTRFYEALDEYRGDAEWAFLETIAQRVAFNRIRSRTTKKRGAPMVAIDDAGVLDEPSLTSHQPDLAEAEHQKQRLRRLYEEMSRLSPAQQQCLQLSLQDHKYEEIAKILRISLDAVKSRIRDAKRILRERLGDEGVLPEDHE